MRVVLILDAKGFAVVITKGLFEIGHGPGLLAVQQAAVRQKRSQTVDCIHCFERLGGMG